jgi:hypothetical protein
LAAAHERIGPIEPGKTREIAIRRAEVRAVLDGERGQNSVHHERADRLAVVQESAQDVPVTLTRIQDTRDRPSEP